MTSRDEQVAGVLEAAQLGHTRSSVAVLSRADERGWRTGSPRPGSTREGQDVEFVPGPVLAAGDDALTSRLVERGKLVGKRGGRPGKAPIFVGELSPAATTARTEL